MNDAAVLTISDSVDAGTRTDASGPAVRQRLEQLGWRVSVAEVLPDDAGLIEPIGVAPNDHRDRAPRAG